MIINISLKPHAAVIRDSHKNLLVSPLPHSCPTSISQNMKTLLLALNWGIMASESPC